MSTPGFPFTAIGVVVTFELPRVKLVVSFFHNTIKSSGIVSFQSSGSVDMLLDCPYKHSIVSTAFGELIIIIGCVTTVLSES
jgi:hypothetical protein